MKAVISVLGEDQVRIMDGNFVMMMSVIIPESIDSYQLTNEFTELGKKIGVEINLRNAKIYDAMHNL